MSLDYLHQQLFKAAIRALHDDPMEAWLGHLSAEYWLGRLARHERMNTD